MTWTVKSSRSTRLARVAVGLALVLAPALLVAETYDVDPVHSAVMFRAKRMGVVYVYGRFDEFAGTLEMSDGDVTSGKLLLEVKTASIDTGNAQRDQHLRSPDFFDAERLPSIRFESTGVKAAGEGAYEVTGNLTLHGVTRPVTATVEQVGTGKDPRSGKSLIGFDGVVTVARSDFDMKSLLGPVGDDVDIHVGLHLVGR